MSEFFNYKSGYEKNNFVEIFKKYLKPELDINLKIIWIV